MHLKRNKVPKLWGLRRKGTKYVVRSSHDLKSGVPVLVILRDILKLTKTRKEVKNLLHSKKIKVNNNLVWNDQCALVLFDIISLDKKNYKLIFKAKKFAMEEVSGQDSEMKISKIIGKKMLKKKLIQINLNDGRNYLFDKKTDVGDSVIINFKENKIQEILPFQEGCKIMFIKGKHIGEQGTVSNIDEKRKIIMVKTEAGEINAKQANLIVIR